MYIILAVYAIQGLLYIVSDQTKSITKSVTPLNLNEEPGFAPAKAGFMKDAAGFDLAFGLHDGSELPVSIGKWSIQYVTKKEGKPKNNLEIPIKKCQKESSIW
jgi:hypothetical protein